MIEGSLVFDLEKEVRLGCCFNGYWQSLSSTSMNDVLSPLGRHLCRHPDQSNENPAFLAAIMQRFLSSLLFALRIRCNMLSCATRSSLDFLRSR